MGRASRAKAEARTQRRRGLRVGGRPGEGLHLVVATTPGRIEDQRFLAHDLNMVRAALLYADTVELLSPVAVMMGGVASLQGQDGWLELLASTDDDTLRRMGLEGEPGHVKGLLAQYRDLMSLPRAERRRRLGKQVAQFGALKASFDEHVRSQDVGGRIEDVLVKAGASELVEALEAGVLTVRSDIAAPTPDDLFDAYVDRLKDLLASPNTHLLVDESTAGLASALVTEGHVAPAALAMARAARARTGSGLVSRLPSFPTTTVGAVLEARTDLAVPLANYRAGIDKLNARMVSDPFDAGYNSEIGDIWRDEVAPAVDTLRRELATTRLAYDAAMNLAMDIKSVMLAGAVVFGVDIATNVSGLTASAGAAMPVVGKAVATAHKERSSRKEQAERHELFYLLEVDKRLGRSR